MVDAFLARAGGAAAPLPGPPAGELKQVVAQGRGAVARGLQAITVTTLQQLNGKAFDTAGFTAVGGAQRPQGGGRIRLPGPRERSRARVRAEEDFTFRGDETVFELILFNLLKNALSYLPTRPDQSITVTIARAPAPRVVVRDTGPGIPPEIAATPSPCWP